MKTIDYQLKSNPKINVEVSLEYSQKAESLIRIILENPSRLIRVLDNHPYLYQPGVLNRAKQLIQNKESKRLQDIVYLRVCIWGNEKKLNGNCNEEILQMTNNLIQKVEELESCKDN